MPCLSCSYDSGQGHFFVSQIFVFLNVSKKTFAHFVSKFLGTYMMCFNALYFSHVLGVTLKALISQQYNMLPLGAHYSLNLLLPMVFIKHD